MNQPRCITKVLFMSGTIGYIPRSIILFQCWSNFVMPRDFVKYYLIQELKQNTSALQIHFINSVDSDVQSRFCNSKLVTKDHSKSDLSAPSSELLPDQGAALLTCASQGSSGETDALCENASPYKAAGRLLIGRCRPRAAPPLQRPARLYSLY
jgi:hypothetical protein